MRFAGQQYDLTSKKSLRSPMTERSCFINRAICSAEERDFSGTGPHSKCEKPEDILRKLLANPPALCLIHIDEDQGIAPELKRRAEIFGVELREDAYVSAGNARSFVLLSVVRRKQIAEMKQRLSW